MWNVAGGNGRYVSGGRADFRCALTVVPSPATISTLDIVAGNRRMSRGSGARSLGVPRPARLARRVGHARIEPRRCLAIALRLRHPELRREIAEQSELFDQTEIVRRLALPAGLSVGLAVQLLELRQTVGGRLGHEAGRRELPDAVLEHGDRKSTRLNSSHIPLSRM